MRAILYSAMALAAASGVANALAQPGGADFEPIQAGAASPEISPDSGSGGGAAQSGQRKPAQLSITLTPMLGSDAQARGGWLGYLAQLSNPSNVPLEGTLHVVEKPEPWVTVEPSLDRSLLTASFSIAPGQNAHIELPLHGYRSQAVKVVALSAGERVLGEATATVQGSAQASLLDLSNPSRIAKALGEHTVVLSPHGATMPTQTLTTSTPLVDDKSGEPMLPRHAALYSNTSLVLAQSDVLMRLPDPEMIALAGWVMAGGSLAITVTRPEDLNADRMVRFLGGTLAETSVSNAAAVALGMVPDAKAPIGSGALESVRLEADDKLRLALTGYTGANAEPSAWGAIASYGMGEVHLLSFDPNRRPFLGDPWVELKLKTLVEHAISRRAHVVSPFGAVDVDDWRTEQVRRSLDPNVGNHWVIVLSAFLLIVYALLAAPLNFHTASRAGTPLKALVRLPLFSLATFACILVLGWISKGGHQKARHLTLVEAGAGMHRASAVRFRAFYAASSRELNIGAMERGNVLDIVGFDGGTARSLHMERDGLRLDGITARPWETVLVREDGFINLDAGIAMQHQSGDVVISNKSGRDLAAVLVARPDGSLFLHERIEDRETVRASDGERLPSPLAASPAPRPLHVADFGTRVDRIAIGLGDALSAWGSMKDAGDWWPSGVPVLLAQWVGGEGREHDAGYPVDSDRVLIRVVGFGGEP